MKRRRFTGPPQATPRRHLARSRDPREPRAEALALDRLREVVVGAERARASNLVLDEDELVSGHARGRGLGDPDGEGRPGAMLAREGVRPCYFGRG